MLHKHIYIVSLMSHIVLFLQKHLTANKNICSLVCMNKGKSEAVRKCESAYVRACSCVFVV